MRIPTYRQSKVSSGSPGAVFSLPAEKRQPMKIPFVDDTRFDSIGKALTKIGTQMYEAEKVENYNAGMILYGEKSPDVINDLKQNGANLSIEEHETKMNEALDILEEDILSNTKNHASSELLKRQFSRERIKKSAIVQDMSYKRQIVRNDATDTKGINTNSDIAILTNDNKTYVDAINDIERIVSGRVASGGMIKEEADNFLIATKSKIYLERQKRLIDESDFNTAINNIKLFNSNDPGELFKGIPADKQDDIKRYAQSHLDSLVTKLNSIESTSNKLMKLQKAENDFNTMMQIMTGKLTKNQFLTIASKRGFNKDGIYQGISQSTFEKGMKHFEDVSKGKKTEIVKDNAVALDIVERVAGGDWSEKTRLEIKQAILNKDMSLTTGKSLLIKSSSKAFAAGLKSINSLVGVDDKFAMMLPARMGELKKNVDDAILHYNRLIRHFPDVDHNKLAKQTIRKFGAFYQPDYWDYTIDVSGKEARAEEERLRKFYLKQKQDNLKELEKEVNIKDRMAEEKSINKKYKKRVNTLNIFMNTGSILNRGVSND